MKNLTSKVLMMKTAMGILGDPNSFEPFERIEPTGEPSLQKPNPWDNVFIPKKLRKGKSFQELEEMRHEIWERSHKN
jgi:hypothetical protein